MSQPLTQVAVSFDAYAILLTIVSKMALVVEVCAGTSNYKEDYHETRSCKAST